MKALRIYVAKPLGVDWKELSSTLSDIQFKTAKILNHCMSEWYLWQRTKEEWKNKNGKYPTSTELPPPDKRLYAEARLMFPDLSSRMVTAIVQQARLRWKTDVKEVFYSQQKSLPSYRKTHPVIVDGQVFTCSKDDKGYVVTVTLKSKKGDGIKRFSFVLNVKKASSTQKSLLNRIFTNDGRKRGNPNFGKDWFIRAKDKIKFLKQRAAIL